MTISSARRIGFIGNFRRWSVVISRLFSIGILAGCLAGCEMESRRSLEMPRGMQRIGPLNMSRPTGLAGGSVDNVTILSLRWSVQPRSGQLTECASRYSEAMRDLLFATDNRRLNQLLVDTGYHVGDIESEWGLDRLEPDQKLISEIYWEQASAFAALGHDEDAIQSLMRSIERGMIDPSRILQSTALTNLRERNDLTPLIERCQQEFVRRREQVIEDAWVRQPAYLSTDLRGLDGKRLDLASFDTPFTLLCCWGTWSRPCIEMLPILNQIASDSEFLGAKTVGILVEPPNASSPEALVATLTKIGATFPNATEDLTANQKSDFSGLLLPSILIVDAKLQIIARLEGYQPREIVEALLHRLTVPSGVSQF